MRNKLNNQNMHFPKQNKPSTWSKVWTDTGKWATLLQSDNQQTPQLCHREQSSNSNVPFEDITNVVLQDELFY